MAGSGYAGLNGERRLLPGGTCSVLGVLQVGSLVARARSSFTGQRKELVFGVGPSHGGRIESPYPQEIVVVRFHYPSGEL